MDGLPESRWLPSPATISARSIRGCWAVRRNTWRACCARTEPCWLAIPKPARCRSPGQQDELIKAIAEHIRGGLTASGSLFDAPGIVVAYKRLATYPVYVAIGRTKASILREWLELTIGYALIGVPAVLGFILLNSACAASYSARADGPCAGARRGRPACRVGDAAPPGSEGRGRRPADRRHRP